MCEKGNYVSATLRSSSITSQPFEHSQWNIQSQKGASSKWKPSNPEKRRGFAEVIKNSGGREKESINEGMIFYFSPWSSQFKLKPLRTWDEMRWNLAVVHMGLGVITSTLVLESNSCDGKPGEQNRKGFGCSIEIQCAINFIICLQMRSTLLQSLECVGVCICMQGGVRLCTLHEYILTLKWNHLY